MGDIESEDTQNMFSRRIQRFLGKRGDQNRPSRVFIRAVNSAQELDDSPKLLAALEEKFQKWQVYLLMIVDMQKSDRLFRLRNASSNMLFYHVKEDLWTQCSRDLLTQRHRCADAYAPGIGAALKYWALNLKAPMLPAAVSDVRTLRAMTQHFDAGSCSTQLYTPNRMREPAYIRVREDWLGGSITYKSNRHGKEFTIPVPGGCKAGQYLEVRIANGLVIDVRIADADIVARLAGAG